MSRPRATYLDRKAVSTGQEEKNPFKQDDDIITTIEKGPKRSVATTRQRELSLLDLAGIILLTHGTTSPTAAVVSHNPVSLLFTLLLRCRGYFLCAGHGATRDRIESLS